MQINVATHPDRIGHIAPNRRARLFKFAQQKGFLRAMWKEHVDRFEMRAGHGENMRRAIDQRRGERLAPQIADIDAFSFQRGNGVKARRLSANGMDSGGCDFDVLAIAEQSPEKAFGHRAAANVPGTDEEDVFHNGERAAPGSRR